jgi:hypothetical protein
MIVSIIVAILIESSAATFALKWSSSKSNITFFSIFVGDALFKMIGLALATWWLLYRSLPYTRPLLTIGFAILFISLIQIPFFYKVP